MVNIMGLWASIKKWFETRNLNIEIENLGLTILDVYEEKDYAKKWLEKLETSHPFYAEEKAKLEAHLKELEEDLKPLHEKYEELKAKLKLL